MLCNSGRLSSFFCKFVIQFEIMMIQVGDKIISKELFENQFICHLAKCEGNCCVFGDSGAPLEEAETQLLEVSIDKIFAHMRPEGRQAIHEKGTWVIDNDGDKVTPLVGLEECAYVYFENDIACCAIEKSFEEGLIDFQKPISCHLYPIRVSKLSNAIALNYHRWSVCEPARLLGKKEGVPVFKFLEGAIRRVYGDTFFNELELIYSELNKQK